MSSYELNRSVLNICIFACTYSSKKRERKQNKIQTESELDKMWVRGELLKQCSLQLSCHVAFINHHISKSWVLLCLEPLERATATLPSCIFVIFAIFAASKEIVKKKEFCNVGTGEGALCYVTMFRGQCCFRSICTTGYRDFITVIYAVCQIWQQTEVLSLFCVKSQDQGT